MGAMGTLLAGSFCILQAAWVDQQKNCHTISYLGVLCDAYALSKTEVLAIKLVGLSNAPPIVCLSFEIHIKCELPACLSKQPANLVFPISGKSVDFVGNILMII